MLIGIKHPCLEVFMPTLLFILYLIKCGLYTFNGIKFGFSIVKVKNADKCVFAGSIVCHIMEFTGVGEGFMCDVDFELPYIWQYDNCSDASVIDCQQ